jgi:hypothetical protein
MPREYADLHRSALPGGPGLSPLWVARRGDEATPDPRQMLVGFPVDGAVGALA